MGAVDPARIHSRLQQVFEASATEALDAAAARIVVFSDQHKGQGDGADDFKRSKRAYHAALGYYLEAGYRLFALGDVEELWECFPGKVLARYRDTLALEAEFHKAGRYVRFFGNHDDIWARPEKVERYLAQFFKQLRVLEGLKVEVGDAGGTLGTIFFAHGHQGTADSEAYAPVSKFFVRHGWRNIQRLFRVRINSPATDFALRKAHDLAMYAWASGRPKTVLVVGHTHRPVFESQSHASTVESALEGVRKGLAMTPGDPMLLDRARTLRAELEWVRAADGAQPDGPARKPCYFNSGCCCFDDGDVTGLEIAEGAIRLVRWPDDAGAPKAQVLASAALRDVFAAL